MATLAALWMMPREITQVAIRLGRPGLYLSMAHETWQEAVEHARHQQAIDTDDVLADDWLSAGTWEG